MGGKTKIMSIALASVAFAFGLSKFTGAGGTERELRALVAGFPQVKVERVGNSLFLRGEVDSFTEMGDLKSIVESLNETNPTISLALLTKISLKGKQAVAQALEREVNSPEIAFEFKRDRLYIEGTAENDFEADRAVELARTYLATGVDWVRSPAKASGTLSTDTPAQHAAGTSVRTNYQIVDMLRVRPRPNFK